MSTEDLLRGLASAPPLRPAPRVGDRLGDRYMIEALLGEGGMGTVYRALDEKLGEVVALKLVRGADDKLRDEVRLAQKVAHPNVCRTFDLEDAGGYQLVKMEYVAGETLAARLHRDGKLPIDEVVRIARAIADGLAAAHARDIVHGDLKPGNVMLDGQRVVLMDFGIARHVASEVDGIRGTIGYIAPELVTERTADARADLYALGCLVYEMLAGERAFDASDPAPELRAKRSDAPRWLARACQELLARSPEDRPVGVARLMAGPRSPLRFVVPAAIVAVAIAGVVTWRLTRRGPAWVAAIRDYPVFQENMDQMAFSPDGKWLVFGSDRDGHGWHVYVMSRTTDGATRLATPAGGNAIAPSFTRDGTAILYGLFDADGLRPHMMRQPVAGVPPRAIGEPADLGPGENPEDCGDAIVFRSRSIGGARLMLRIASGETRELYRGAMSPPTCDPSGQQIAIITFAETGAGGGDVALIDRAGNLRHVTSDHDALGVTFASDGRSLIVSRLVDNKQQLYELGLDGGPPRRLVVDQGPDGQASVSHDGRYLAFTRDNASPYPVLVTPTGARQLTKRVGTYRRPQFVGASSVVVEAREEDGFAIELVHVDDGAVSRLADGTCPFPSIDHAAVYFQSAPGVLSVVSIDGGASHRVATLPGPILHGNAGPDGEHLLVQIGDRLAGYHVTSDGHVEPDGVRGLVSVAPTGGWRAVTLFSDALGGPLELALVRPGGTLDQTTRRFAVVSLYNRWLDDHRISYCVQHRCAITDVASDTTTTIEAAGADAMMTIAPDEKSLLSEDMFGTVTRHIITNFDQR